MSKFSSIKPLYNKNNKPYSNSDQYFSIPTSLSGSKEELYPICRTISEEAFSFETFNAVIKTDDTYSIVNLSPNNTLQKLNSLAREAEASQIIARKIPRSSQKPIETKSLPFSKSTDPDSGRTLFINRSFEEPRNNGQDASSKLPLFAFHSTGDQSSNNDPTTELTGDLSATDVSSFGE